MKIHHHHQHRRIVVAALLAMPVLAGCPVISLVPNPDHCAHNEGDAYCAEVSPEAPYCTKGLGECSLGGNFGCVADPPAECRQPCGALSEDDCDGMGSSSGEGSGSGSSSDGGTTAAESSGTEDSGTSTTGPIPCTGNEDCTDAAAPFCDPAGECVDCGQLADGNAACADVDPGLPVCEAGSCVACTADDLGACDGATPICDVETNTCVPCTDHDQCGEAACNLFTGACLPIGAVVHVGSGQTFSSISAAVASFGAGAEGTIIVHAGDYNNQAVTVNGGRTLAFLANQVGVGVQPPRWVQSAGGSPQLTVGNATVLLDGIQVSGNASAANPGVLVDGGQAWLDRSRVVTNLGGGIVAQGTAELVLRNCFVGGDVNDIDSIVVSGSTATIDYSTVGAGFGAATALTCSSATLAARNSLFVARTDTNEVVCNGETFEHSAAEQDLGGTNEPLGAMSTSWFVGYATGDFHLLTPPITVAGAAQWQDGDPATDIDGQARPSTDGATDVAGADVP